MFHGESIKFIISSSLSGDWLGGLLLSSPIEYLQWARLCERPLCLAYLDEFSRVKKTET